MPYPANNDKIFQLCMLLFEGNPPKAKPSRQKFGEASVTESFPDKTL